MSGLKVWPASKAVVKPGVWIPDGALDRWKAARNASSSARAEVVAFGDSTTYGQTATGNANTSANNYSWVQKLRALSIAAGYTDGGLGIRGFYDPAALSAEALAHISANSGFVASTNAQGLLTYGISSGAAGSVGNSVTVQGKGSVARVFYTQFGTGGGVVSWSADGGAATGSLDGRSGVANYRIQYVDIPLSGSGTHTITFTVTTSGQIDFTVDWLNTAGIVWHKQGIPGKQVTQIWPNLNQVPFMAASFGLGIGENINGTGALSVPYGMTKTGPRSPSLAIFHMGINDQQGISSQATALNFVQTVEAGIGVFAQMCKQAQCDGLVCIPHLVYATNYLAYGGNVRRAISQTAVAYGLAVADLELPVTPVSNAATYGGAAAGNAPHLNQAGYDAQAQFLWDNVLSK